MRGGEVYSTRRSNPTIEISGGKKMRVSKLVSALGLVLLSTVSVAAQEQAAVVGALEMQTPKSGMIKQYEDGRKQKATWHKQQNDTAPLFVWSVRSGEHTGAYIVGRFGSWADLDKPSVPEAADLEEYNKVVSPYVQSMTAAYYEAMPKFSNAGNMSGPAKLSEIITFHVRSGHGDDFRSGIERVTEGAKKTQWPVNYEWYYLASGGPAGVYVLVLPHASWADFADKPGVKSFQEMLKDAFGQAEADSVVKRLDSAIESEMTEAIEFRSDLSYIPSK
jgi:hypothetical protein